MTPAAAAPVDGHEHHGGESGIGRWFGTGCAVLLILLLVNALWPQPQPMGRGDLERKTMPDVDSMEMSVNGMRCNGCVESVTRALKESTGVESAVVDLAAGRASVRGTDFDRSMLADKIRALGFEVEVGSAE